jgi:hypothetical protein
MKRTVPICDDCGKPHFGRRNVEDRCICDTFGRWHYGEIEEEKGMTKQELLDKLEDIVHNGGDEEADHANTDNLLLKYINEPDVTILFNKINKRYV